MNTNFNVIGLTRLKIKPEFRAQEADALTTRPSELQEKMFACFCHTLASLQVVGLDKPFFLITIGIKYYRRGLDLHWLQCLYALV